MSIRVIGICALLGVAGYFVWPRLTALFVGDTPVLRALGGTWQVSDLVWHEIEGEWRVSATMKPKRVPPKTIQISDILSGFCGALLSELPRKPDANLTRDSVYRVDLNVERQKPTADGQKNLWPANLPVPVENGACVIPAESEQFFPVYPGKLKGWRLEGVGVTKQATENYWTVIFRPTKGEEFSVEDFAYKAACEAAIADPLASSKAAAFKGVDESLPVFGTKKLAVTVQDPLGVGSLTVGRFQTKIFDIFESACVLVELGDKT